MICDSQYLRIVHGGGEAVVRRLAQVDIDVAMYRRLRPKRAAQQLDRPVREDLVEVHVRLGARARLPNVKREVFVELAGDHLVGGPDDRIGAALLQSPGACVHQGSCLLHIAIGVVRRLRHEIVATRKVLKRSLGLRAPIAIGRHLDSADAVELLTFTGRLDADRQVLQRWMTGVLVTIAHRASFFTKRS